MKIVVLGTLRFPPDQLALVRPHLQKLVAATQAQDGCHAYDVAEDPFDPGLIRFSEMWPSYESLENHLRAPHIAPWRQICTEHRLLERSFHAFEVGSERAI